MQRFVYAVNAVNNKDLIAAKVNRIFFAMSITIKVTTLSITFTHLYKQKSSNLRMCVYTFQENVHLKLNKIEQIVLRSMVMKFTLCIVFEK